MWLKQRCKYASKFRNHQVGFDSPKAVCALLKNAQKISLIDTGVLVTPVLFLNSGVFQGGVLCAE